MYPTQVHSYLLWRSSVDPDAQALASRRFTATVSLLPATMVGMFVFGWWAGVIVLISLGTAFLTDFLCHKFIFKDSTGTRDGIWLLTGLLLALFLPPNVGWWVPVIGVLVAIVIGKYWSAVDNMPLWQPVLVGLLALYICGFARPSTDAAGVPQWPELTRRITREKGASVTQGRAMAEVVQQFLRDFFGGDIRNAKPRDEYRKLSAANGGAPPADAISGPRPIDEVKARPKTDVSTNQEGYDSVQMLLGYVPGSIGGASALALIFGILLLIFTGAVHWALPLFALGTLYGGLHLFACGSSTPIIAENINIHMLTGSTLLGVFYLAADPLTAPRSLRGKIYAGVAFGLIELLLRMITPLTEGVIISVVIVQGLSMVIDQWLAPPVESNTHPPVGLTSSTLGRL
jgi:electron transport complex protein RnfD